MGGHPDRHLSMRRDRRGEGALRGENSRERRGPHGQEQIPRCVRPAFNETIRHRPVGGKEDKAPSTLPPLEPANLPDGRRVRHPAVKSVYRIRGENRDASRRENRGDLRHAGAREVPAGRRFPVLGCGIRRAATPLASRRAAARRLRPRARVSPPRGSQHFLPLPFRRRRPRRELPEASERSSRGHRFPPEARSREELR